MKINGDGGANTNLSGKPFEECVLMNFEPDQTYVIGDKNFTYVPQDKFVKVMKEYKDPYWTHNKKPDGALVSEDRETVILIECKHQIVAGSVDEKLRCGPCLLEEYKKLYPSVKNIHMMFIVNEWWFKQRKYEIPIEFNRTHGIPVFFAKQVGRKWKIHIQKRTNKWTIFPALYEVDENEIKDWMTKQVLQSS